MLPNHGNCSPRPPSQDTDTKMNHEERPLLPILDLEGDYAPTPAQNARANSAAFFCVCVPVVLVMVAIMGLVSVRMWIV